MRDGQVPVHGQCHSDSKLLRTRVDQGEATDALSYVRQVKFEVHQTAENRSTQFMHRTLRSDSYQAQSI
jgi:hypothetical protein